MSKKEETRIQADIIDYLNFRRVWNFRYQAQVNKFGLPDIIAIYKGYFLGLEVKTKTGKATDLQLRTLESIRKAGGYAELVTSVDDVKELLNKINAA